MLELELVGERVAQEATEKENTDKLWQMKSIAVDVSLHARAKLMEEYKAGKQAK